MPGKRDKQIRDAFLVHLDAMLNAGNIDENKKDRLLKTFDAQKAKGTNRELFYFNSLSFDEFNRQIKLFEKCDTDISGAMMAFTNDKSISIRSPYADAYIQALFASDPTVDPIIEVNYNDDFYTNLYDKNQQKIISMPLTAPKEIPEELREKTVIMAAMGLSLKDSIIGKTFALAGKEDQLKGQGDVATNSRVGLFDNMINSNDSRGNMHLIKLGVPEARELCQKALDDYARGNKQPLADAVYENFIQCHNYLSDSKNKDNYVYYFCLDTMESCLDVLQQTGLMDLVNITPAQLTKFNTLKAEKELFEEKDQLKERLWESVTKHLLDEYGENALQAKPLDDPDTEKLYLRYAAMDYIRKMNTAEVTEYLKAKSIPADPSYKREAGQNRPLNSYESFCASQKELLIEAVIKTVVIPGPKYQKIKNMGWKDFGGSFKDSEPSPAATDVKLRYPEIIKLMNKCIELYGNRDDFKDVVANINEMLDLDKELSKNGLPDLDILEKNIVAPLGKIYTGLSQIKDPLTEKVSYKTASPEENALFNDVQNFISGVERIEDRIRETRKYYSIKNKIQDEMILASRTKEDDLLLEELGLTREDIRELVGPEGSVREYIDNIRNENKLAEDAYARQESQKTVLNEAAASSETEQKIRKCEEYTELYDRQTRESLKGKNLSLKAHGQSIAAREDLLNIVKNNENIEESKLNQLFAKAIFGMEIAKHPYEDNNVSRAVEGVIALEDYYIPIEQAVNERANNPVFKYMMKNTGNSRILNYLEENGLEELRHNTALSHKYIKRGYDIAGIIGQIEEQEKQLPNFEEGSYKRVALENAVKFRKEIFFNNVLHDERDLSVITRNIASLICCEEMLKENRDPSMLPTSREEVEAELKNRTERLLNDEVFQANTKPLKGPEVLEFINKDGIKVFANDFDAKVERCKKNIMAEYDSLDEGMDESQRMFKINSAEAKSILWEYVSGKNEGSGTGEADGRESEYSQEDLKKLVARVMYCDITLARGKYEMDRGSLETKIENVYNNSYFQRITQNLNKEMILDLLEKGGPKRLANKVKAAQQAPSAEETQKEEKQEEIKENVPVVGEPIAANSAGEVKDNIDTASAEKREDNIVEEQQKEEEKQEEIKENVPVVGEPDTVNSADEVKDNIDTASAVKIEDNIVEDQQKEEEKQKKPPVNTVAEEKTSSEEDTKQEEIKENVPVVAETNTEENVIKEENNAVSEKNDAPEKELNAANAVHPSAEKREDNIVEEEEEIEEEPEELNNATDDYYDEGSPLFYDPMADYRRVEAYNRRLKALEKEINTSQLTEKEKAEKELEFKKLSKANNHLQKQIRKTLSKRSREAYSYAETQTLKKKYMDKLIEKSPELTEIVNNFSSYAIGKNGQERLFDKIQAYLKKERAALEKSIPDTEAKKVPYTAVDVMSRCYQLYNKKVEAQAEEHVKGYDNHAQWLDSTEAETILQVDNQWERDYQSICFIHAQSMVNTMKPHQIRAIHAENIKLPGIEHKPDRIFTEKEALANADVTRHALNIIHDEANQYMQTMRFKVYDVFAHPDDYNDLTLEMKQNAIAMILTCNAVIAAPESAKRQIVKGKLVPTKDFDKICRQQELMEERFMEGGISNTNKNETFEKWATQLANRTDFKKMFAIEKNVDATLKTLVDSKDDPDAFLIERKLLDKVFEKRKFIVDTAKPANNVKPSAKKSHSLQ